MDASLLGEWSIRDIITATLVLVSAFLCFAAGVGLLRFPDVLSRLHAATKPQILGVAVIVLDVAVSTPSIASITMAVAIVGFQSLTSPLAAHMVGRAAHRTGHFDPGTLVVDELATTEGTSGRGGAGS